LDVTNIYRILTDDLEQVLRDGNAIDEEDLGLGRRLIAEDDFKIWLNHRSSVDILLVDGHCADLGNRGTTPVSVFCAQLAAVMQQVDSVIPMAFFCGQHTSRTDALAGPRGVLLGLIVELITRLGTPERVETLIDQGCLADIARRDISALAKLFLLLLHHHPLHISIFCILDNMSELEDTITGPEEDLRLLVDTLYRAVHEKSVGAIKVLMTFGNKSVEICDFPGPHKQLSLRAANLRSGSTSSDSFTQEIFATLSPKSQVFYEL
jgi:hypothetical protein